jgi:hypothetical protein
MVQLSLDRSEDLRCLLWAWPVVMALNDSVTSVSYLTLSYITHAKHDQTMYPNWDQLDKHECVNPSFYPLFVPIIGSSKM